MHFISYEDCLLWILLHKNSTGIFLLILLSKWCCKSELSTCPLGLAKYLFYFHHGHAMVIIYDETLPNVSWILTIFAAALDERLQNIYKLGYFSQERWGDFNLSVILIRSTYVGIFHPSNNYSFSVNTSVTTSLYFKVDLWVFLRAACPSPLFWSEIWLLSENGGS